MIDPGTLLDDGIGVASEVERLDAGDRSVGAVREVDPRLGEGQQSGLVSTGACAVREDHRLGR
jgi:hypothetical protein